jgi:integrase/recombinase XerC
MSDLIKAHLRHMRAAGLAELTTVDDRECLLRRLDRILPMGLDRATTEELEDFLATPGWSAQTKATYYTHIVGYYRWGCDPLHPHLDYDPSAGLRRPKVPRNVPKPVTNAQVQFALVELPEPFRTYVTLATYAGARCGEIAMIEKEAITEERIRIKGKGGKTRVLATHPAVWAAVRPFPAGRIARRYRGGEPADSPYVSTRTRIALRRIGLDVTLHQFRHWYGTMMLRPRQFGGAGASLRCVQENMGHESAATTAGYTLVSDEERDAGIAALPTFTTPTSC